MLNFETIRFISKAAEYNSNISTKLIIVGALAIISVLLIIAIYNKEKLEKFIPLCMLFCIVSMALLFSASAVYCEAIVEVTPTREINVESVKNNKNFEEKDGKIFFKCNLSKAFLESDKSFKDKDQLIKEIQEKFNYTISNFWMENRLK